MKTAPISKLKATLSEYIAQVKKGEEVLVTERGKPVARLVPVSAKTSRESHLQELIRRGVVRPGKPISKAWIDSMPICNLPEGTAQRLIDEEREGR